jgi:hypothetical protein
MVRENESRKTAASFPRGTGVDCSNFMACPHLPGHLGH